MIKISPSVMCCESVLLKSWIEAFEAEAIDEIHFDVMDGHFVDNITLGTTMFNDVRRYTKIPIDMHLMCYKPEKIVRYFNIVANDKVSFHPEATDKAYWLLQEIRKMGARAGIVLNPGTPLSYIDELKDQLDFIMIMTVNPGFAGQKMTPNALDKIRRVKEKCVELGLNIDIEVDGNTTTENACKMVEAGANTLVVGTSSVLANLETFKEDLAKYRQKISQ